MIEKEKKAVEHILKKQNEENGTQEENKFD